LLGRGETKNGGADKPKILADTYEAVVGAVFLDGGYEAAKEVVSNHLGKRISAAKLSVSDPKTELQELSQKLFHQGPTYEVLDISGPDHERHFRVAVSIGDHCRSEGEGGNRKSAEQMAAASAIVILKQSVTADSNVGGQGSRVQVRTAVTTND